jgi:hypothetical protein
VVDHVQIDPASFRDPSGFVFRRDGVLYRQVNGVHREHFDHFVDSGLCSRLIEEQLLISHEVVDPSIAATADAYRVLEPERVPFVSYPYEWSFEMLRDAGAATLQIQRIALDYGMSLRDASAYNITFYRGRPVLIDTTSFEILPQGRPWVAYRQFCQHFIAPLAVMSYRDVRLGQLPRIYLDGIPLDLAAELLPARSRTRAGLTMHLRLHARSQRKHGGEGAGNGDGRQRDFSARAFHGLLESLSSTVDGLAAPHGASEWSEYDRQADHYSEDAAMRKVQIVEAWISSLGATSLWDLGANRARFSRLASDKGIGTVALDSDPFCVDHVYQEVRKNGERNLLPVVQDFTNPSGGTGWLGEERSSLEARAPADAVLALALIHHLAIANNVPLPMVCDLFSRLGRRAIVEWVPKEDPKVQFLLRDREDVFSGYTQSGFEAAARTKFVIGEREPVADSGRFLYRLEPL